MVFFLRAFFSVGFHMYGLLSVYTFSMWVYFPVGFFSVSIHDCVCVFVGFFPKTKKLTMFFLPCSFFLPVDFFLVKIFSCLLLCSPSPPPFLGTTLIFFL